MTLSQFIAFTQQPQIHAAFAGLWSLPPFFSIQMKSGQNVYAFVYFGTHLRTFSRAMYTFASLKCILLSSCPGGMQMEDFSKRVSHSLITSRTLLTTTWNYLQKYYFLLPFIIFWRPLSRRLCLNEESVFWQRRSIEMSMPKLKKATHFYSFLLISPHSSLFLLIFGNEPAKTPSLLFPFIPFYSLLAPSCPQKPGTNQLNYSLLPLIFAP